MWWLFSIASALCQVGRNSVMKNLGHSLDEYISVWGRFFFLLPLALAASWIVGFPSLGPAVSRRYIYRIPKYHNDGRAAIHFQTGEDRIDLFMYLSEH